MIKKGTGFLVLPKDKIDKRDYLFASRKPFLAPSIPSSYDGRIFCGPILDQLQTSSCTGQSHASVEDMLWMAGGKAQRVFSPLFSYWNARDVQGWTKQDQGAYIFDVLKQFKKYGIAPESLHPFKKGVFSKPDMWAFGFGKFFGPKEGSYYKITDANMDKSFVDDVKVAIANGYGVIGGITIFDDFYSPQSGVINMPIISNSEKVGGHAMHWIGYVDLEGPMYQKALDDEIGFETIIINASKVPTSQGFLIFKNSWGVEYGRKGYGMIPYEYVDEYGNDFWAIKK